MKRLLALALCLCFLLGGCAQNEPPQPVADGDTAQDTQKSTAPQPAPAASGDYQKLALGLAALPELPEEPDESALWEQMSGKNSEERNKLWDEYSEKQAAYSEAVTALRGEGVDAALTPALARYTLRTARQLAADETEKNVVYSPANLYLALCMLAETAGGESRAQLLDLLGLSSIEQARTAANALWRDLYRSGQSSRTLLANSVWLNEQVDFHQDTVDTLANEYYASAFRAPMGNPATDAAIHEWINENTNHLLEEAANGLQTDVNTLMMLISTLYFKGTWSSQFNEYATSKDIFTAANGAEQRIEFMHSAGNGTYYRGENFIAASLPFRDGTAMWFLLPDAGVSVQSLLPDEDNVSICIDAPEGTVQDTAFGPIFAQAGYAELHWSVPKFDADSDLDLIPALQALGVTDVFVDGTADFSPLTDMDAVVSAVKHAARVKVNEEGCEAAAFTAIMVETTALPMPQPVVEINLNRPFAFLITGADGLPLFAGVVNTME